MPDLQKQVQEWATEAGFELSGVAPVPSPDFPELDYFGEWIKAGRAGEMEYLKRQNEQGELKRSGLRNALPWARSVIVCALNYNTAQPYSSGPYSSDHAHKASSAENLPASPDADCGWISRYAWGGESDDRGSDYHDEVLRRLRSVEARFRAVAGESPELQTRCYVDTGPVVERVYARYAGIGWFGKNTCILNQQMGSWLFLGIIVTSLPLQPAEALPLPPPDRCGSCTRCLDACPTQAFVAPRELDATRCISYLTIEKRGSIAMELREGMGRHVFGCDICQEVCPWNRRAPHTSATGLQARPSLVNPALEWLASLSPDDFRSTFRGTPIQRAKYSGFRRNVAIAMGNSRNRKFVPQLQQWSASEDAVLSETAQWALAQIDKGN